MLSIILGISGFIAAFLYMINNHSTSFTGFVDKSALLLLSTAPLCVVTISHGFLGLLSSIKSLLVTVFSSHTREMRRLSDELTNMSLAIRNDGMGALSFFLKKTKNPLFQEGITLILNGFSREEIKHNLTAKINTRQVEFQGTAELFETLGKLSPGIGLIGTVVGLVTMMTNLQNPSQLGSGMAVALLSTLYGLILGNVLYMPIGDKMNIYGEKVLLRDTMIMEGVLLLKEKKSYAHLRDVLKTYSRHGQISHQQPPSFTGNNNTDRKL
jgi:chemotaxis protein MotA